MSALPVVPCSRCGLSVRDRIGHLVAFHQMTLEQARADARDAEPLTKESPMPRPCANCGTVGHGRKTCPTAPRADTPRRGSKPKTSRRPPRALAVAPVKPVPPALIEAAKALLRDKLDEALVDARAEQRALERLAGKLG